MSLEQGDFIPIRKERTSRLIEKQIKQAIFNKRYPVGAKLPTEREFAETFHVSRTTVREAFRSLERSGLITIKKGAQGGAFVSKGLSKHVVESMVDMFDSGEISLEEILQARLIIEPSVAAEAARKATPEDVERLKETNRMLREGYKTGDPGIENNPRTHRAIADMTNNKVIRMIMNVLMDVHTARMSNIKLDDEAKSEILGQHEEIIDIIMKNDIRIAFDKMREHILRVHEIHKEIEERNSAPAQEKNGSL